jgi:hypothetical protein
MTTAAKVSQPGRLKFESALRVAMIPTFAWSRICSSGYW